MKNKYVQKLARGVVAAGNFVKNHAKKICVGAVSLGGALVASAQTGTDATIIATNAQTAFATIAPITITIAGFYVILTLAKRVVR